MTPTSVRTIPEQEDTLALLPATVPVRYKRNAVIYSEWEQAGHLYLIVRGRVKVTRGGGGRSVVIDVYGPNEFFGEAGCGAVARASRGAGENRGHAVDEK
jgi:CRP-like cAMP-binding protein